MTQVSDHAPGVQGVEDPLASSGESDTSASELSDTATARLGVVPAGRDSGAASSRSARLDSRYSVVERRRLDAHAARLGIKPSQLQRAATLDAVDARGGHLRRLEAAVESPPVPGLREAASEVRRVGINLNALMPAVHAGKPVTIDAALLRAAIDAVNDVRELLGDRISR